MKFIVEDTVFNKLSNVCFGVVVARNLDCPVTNSAIASFLNESIKLTEARFDALKVKECPEILPYREAFLKLGINPNKFMNSIEAMASRIEKKKGFPEINPIVDLGNAIALKYLVPLGAHDLGEVVENIEVRFAKEGDYFIPFGQNDAEIPDEGELIYAVGNKVKTRRWIWRQSELGKVTKNSKNIFFPVDGFSDINLKSVIKARDELAGLLEKYFHCQVSVGLVDRNQQHIEI